MLIARAAGHESSRVLDSSGSSTRNTEAPPEFLCRRTCDAIALVWISIGVLPPTPADGNQMNATNGNTVEQTQLETSARQAWRLGCAVG